MTATSNCLELIWPPTTPRYVQPKKKSGPKIDLDAPLSPEADKFLAEATAEFNAKQERCVETGALTLTSNGDMNRPAAS